MDKTLRVKCLKTRKELIKERKRTSLVSTTGREVCYVVSLSRPRRRNHIRTSKDSLKCSPLPILVGTFWSESDKKFVIHYFHCKTRNRRINEDDTKITKIVTSSSFKYT